MFKNISSKIKGFAPFFLCLGILASIITGIVLMVKGAVAGLWICLLGPLASWIFSCLFYGFGELIENTSIIVKNTTKAESGTKGSTTQSKRAKELKKLYSQGKLTKEEYDEAVENLAVLIDED
ncbi:MAG: hypothetical protein IKC52_04245 [Clostridia bacterium]|nr:hypothetical protein [Clostridia bacterium]